MKDWIRYWAGLLAAAMFDFKWLLLGLILGGALTFAVINSHA